MSSGSAKIGAPTKTGPAAPVTVAAVAAAALTNVPPSTQAILLEKLNARTSTPDSEALASSDDEGGDPHHHHHHYPHLHNRPDPVPVAPVQKPVRRPSWLNEPMTTVPVQQRKGSFAGNNGNNNNNNNNNMSPTASNPTTPSADPGAGPWASSGATAAAATTAAAGSGLGRQQPAAPAFTWGQAIWNSSERKEPASSRLSEVLPSPTSQPAPGSSSGGGGSFFGNHDVSRTQPSPGPRETGPIPFAIPLHPTPKTYRSQSYSVGQLEPDAPAPPGSAAPGCSSSHVVGRHRGHHPGLHHRPSRPSMLSEMSSEGGLLGKVKEVDDDDDDDSIIDPIHSAYHVSSESKTIERLTRENAVLRQQQHQQQHQHQSHQPLHQPLQSQFHHQQSQYQQQPPPPHAHQQQQKQQQQQQGRMRTRPSAGAAYGLGNGHGLPGSVPEESDFAIDELDESGDGSDLIAHQGLTRRMSEFGASTFGSYTMDSSGSSSLVENRKLENLKKASWATSPFFTGLADLSQSRRHSFADIPMRQPSMSSLNEPAGGQLDAGVDPHQQDFSAGLAGLGDSPFGPSNPATTAASYFTAGPAGLSGHSQAQFGNPYVPSPYGIHHSSFANRPPSPHRNMYTTISQPRHNQPLYIVLFKCARADVFYIQEGMGLSVKKGDLVIVEADRGTDLGTVAVDAVDWHTARELKEHFAEEHYKWLMMYASASHEPGGSGGSGGGAGGSGGGLAGPANGPGGSAIGGMGPIQPAQNQHHAQEPGVGELKPKMIKRLAQQHEIHTLREKEGNEAKAKRTCMQKVKEHNLNMEILDAEYQMDWKKLTFYYFANSYINFNSLVTDLFKIYKTRIWMSAINPASFASPTLGIQAPSGIGIGAVGIRGPLGSERRQSQAPMQESQQQQQSQQSNYAPAVASRAFQMPIFTQPNFGVERQSPPSGPVFSPGAYAYPQFAALANNNNRHANFPYIPQNMTAQAPDAMAGGGFDYGSPIAGRTRFASPPGAAKPDGRAPGVSPVPPQNEWMTTFQSLSLNSR